MITYDNAKNLHCRINVLAKYHVCSFTF